MMRRTHEPIIWVVPDAVKAGVVVRARPGARTTLLNSLLQVVFSCPPRQFDITDCNVGLFDSLAAIRGVRGQRVTRDILT